MKVEADQVEAHAAQGYSLADVARLLGVPFFVVGRQTNEHNAEVLKAFERGAERWHINGQSIPPRAVDIIAQAVHSQLLNKEMTRGQLKEALGFRHDDLNLAVETLEAQFLIEHREDGIGPCYYRAAGTPAAKPERSSSTAPLTRESFIETLETVSRPKVAEPNEPSVPKPEKISARSDRAEEVAAEPEVESEALCGCGRAITHKGRCAARRAAAGGDFPASKMKAPPVLESLLSDSGKNITKIITTKEEPPVQEEKDTRIAARRTTSTEVYGDVRLYEEVQVRVSEMANWPAAQIAEFFSSLAQVVEIPQQIAPRQIKHAWSPDFESDQSPDGCLGLTYLYLVSMLHDGMEENEKDAVWTLIKYLKRMEAASQAAKVKACATT